MNFLAHKLSTLCPYLSMVNVKSYRPQKLISPLVISGYMWSPTCYFPLKTISLKKGIIKFGPKEYEFVPNNKK
jgi:hypothetical protein